MPEEEVLRACGFEEEMLRMGVTSGFEEKELRAGRSRNAEAAQRTVECGCICVFVCVCDLKWHFVHTFPQVTNISAVHDITPHYCGIPCVSFIAHCIMCDVVTNAFLSKIVFAFFYFLFCFICASIFTTSMLMVTKAGVSGLTSSQAFAKIA